MTKHSPFRYFKTSPEVIRLAVCCMFDFRFLSRNVEDLLRERETNLAAKGRAVERVEQFPCNLRNATAL